MCSYYAVDKQRVCCEYFFIDIFVTYRDHLYTSLITHFIIPMDHLNTVLSICDTIYQKRTVTLGGVYLSIFIITTSIRLDENVTHQAYHYLVTSG